MEHCNDVWRVEFQLRRQLLKQLKVNDLDDLVYLAGTLWRYLAGDWMSLRLPDNLNATRRTVHRWWQAVREVGSDFGVQLAIQRDYGRSGDVPAGWYESHCAGCLVGYAARLGVTASSSAATRGPRSAVPFRGFRP